MQNPKYQRYADRLKELIEEGKKVASLEKPSSVGPYIQSEDRSRLNAWLVKVKNIIDVAFGVSSQHYIYLEGLFSKYRHNIEHSYEVNEIRGLLEGALDDLEKGFLTGQEFLIAGEIFDSVLEQAKELNKKGYKDPAAVLARVVVEDALRRIARKEGLDDTKKASELNTLLWKKERYTQPRWKRIEVWLTIGNVAAHGKFDEYTSEDVKTMIDEIERFLAEELQIG